MRWRSVIGFFAGRSFGSPLASKPSSTCGLARSGSSLPIGSSSESLPCSTSCMPAAARDRLAHGGDPEHAVGGHGIVLRQVAFAERALIDHLTCRSQPSRPRRNFLRLAFLTQNLIDLGFALHGSPPALIFYGVARSSSRPLRSRKRLAERRRPMSRSRDGMGWAVVGIGAAPNCNTSPQSAVDGRLRR